MDGAVVYVALVGRDSTGAGALVQAGGFDRGGPAPSDVNVRVAVMAVWRFLPQ